MEKIWKAAFAVAGIGAVAFFVFYSLYKQWLTLPIFERLSQQQTFAVMVIFLVLSFGSLIAGLVAWLRAPQTPPLAQAPVQPALEASREFFIGRWEVQQKIGAVEGGSYMDYFENGRFEGVMDQFLNGQGRRDPINGTWEIARLSKDKFCLTATFDGGGTWKGNFRIVDRDRIHNMTDNYEAVRVVR